MPPIVSPPNAPACVAGAIAVEILAGASSRIGRGQRWNCNGARIFRCRPVLSGNDAPRVGSNSLVPISLYPGCAPVWMYSVGPAGSEGHYLVPAGGLHGSAFISGR